MTALPLAVTSLLNSDHSIGSHVTSALHCTSISSAAPHTYSCGAQPEADNQAHNQQITPTQAETLATHGSTGLGCDTPVRGGPHKQARGTQQAQTCLVLVCNQANAQPSPSPRWAVPCIPAGLNVFGSVPCFGVLLSFMDFVYVSHEQCTILYVRGEWCS